jgi:hypothetical protein
MRRLRQRRLTEEILSSLHEDSRGALLREFLRHGAKVYVLAGAVRDVFVLDCRGKGEAVPRDFDIGISQVSRALFDSVVHGFGERNRHGGYVLKEALRPQWDVWRMEDSIGLRKTGTPYTLENVLRTFNLNCNAIAMDIHKGELLDAGVVEAVRRQELSFLRNRIVHSRGTFAAKAVLLQLRFGWSMSAELERFVGKHLTHRALLHEALKVFPGVSVLNRSLHQDQSEHGKLWLRSRGLTGQDPMETQQYP